MGCVERQRRARQGGGKGGGGVGGGGVGRKREEGYTRVCESEVAEVLGRNQKEGSGWEEEGNQGQERDEEEREEQWGRGVCVRAESNLIYTVGMKNGGGGVRGSPADVGRWRAWRRGWGVGGEGQRCISQGVQSTYCLLCNTLL